MTTLRAILEEYHSFELVHSFQYISFFNPIGKYIIDFLALKDNILEFMEKLIKARSNPLNT
ncbi:hypothetical protein DU80_14470 [Methanosarcina mazei]|uniref:Uncharacterized protein n=1 Tax=Methanosarcina mazei TaxID=2209 RepID=A0A0F8BQN0_METMZ|nr:hypothetical protein DU47_13770 [Methanosarcina mazei]KKH90510.1 hypothetical protein DU80_14470 [Methanosarcina mazei]BBL64226.1 hypothetical protein MmazTMA_12030 [Methanosarcina mazei]